jgi:hypothetical protein
MRTILPKYIDITIHSMVDLITNSSSETFITATGSTVKIVKEIINKVLKLGKSEFTADDLFEFKLIAEIYDEETGNEETKEVTNKMIADWEGDESPPTVTLEVKAKNIEDKLGKETAKLLSSLENLFEISTRYS